MRNFVVSACWRERVICCGTFEAGDVSTALNKTTKEKLRWAAEQLKCDEADITWEVSEDFL